MQTAMYIEANYLILLWSTLFAIDIQTIQVPSCKPESDFEVNSTSTETCTTGFKADHRKPNLLCQQIQHI